MRYEILPIEADMLLDIAVRDDSSLYDAIKSITNIDIHYSDGSVEHCQHVCYPVIDRGRERVKLCFDSDSKLFDKYLRLNVFW